MASKPAKKRGDYVVLATDRTRFGGTVRLVAETHHLMTTSPAQARRFGPRQAEKYAAEYGAGPYQLTPVLFAECVGPEQARRRRKRRISDATLFDLGNHYPED